MQSKQNQSRTSLLQGFLILLIAGLAVVSLYAHFILPTELTGAAVGILVDANSTNCGTVNGDLTLSRHIIINETCLIVNRSNIIIDGAGYSLTYNGSTSASAITIINFNNVTVRNFLIYNFSSGVNGLNASNLSVWNNTITGSNHTVSSAHAIALNNVTYSNISGNRLVSTWTGSAGIRLDLGHNNSLVGNNIAATVNGSYGINIDTSNDNFIVENTITVQGGDDTLALFLNIIDRTTVRSNIIHAQMIDAAGVSVVGNNNFIESNNITSIGGAAIIIFPPSSNNIFVNNNVSAGIGLDIFDASLPTTLNTALYNNSFGQINWTLGNITTNSSLLVGTTIFLENNLVGLIDSAETLLLNGTAQIQIKNLSYLSTPQLLRNGVRCDQSIICNITYDPSSNTLFANVSSFSNYTTNEAAPARVIIINPANGSNFSTVSIAFNATVLDDNSSVQSVLFSFTNATGIPFNATAANVSGNWNILIDGAVFFEGLHMMTVLANDSAGNYNRTESVQFTIDRTPPNISAFFTNTSSNNNSNFTRGGTLQINATLNDSTTIVETVKFGIANPSNNSEFNVTAVKAGFQWQVNLGLTTLSDAVYLVRIYGNDTLNNLNNSVSNLTFRIDSTPPNITAFGMNVSNGATVSGGAIQFNATINDSITSVQSVLFGFTNNANSSEFNVTALRNETGGVYQTTVQLATMGDGSYQVRIYANDTLSNVNNSVSNLTFTLSTAVAGGPGSGGGGGTSGGGGGTARPEVIECTSNTQCKKDWFCVHQRCVQLFDLKILNVDSPLAPGELLDFVYLMKNMANESGDVTLRFLVTDWSGREVATGADVIFIESGEQKIEMANLFLPSSLAEDVYQFSITLVFGKYVIQSSRTIEVRPSVPLIITIVPLDLPRIVENSPWQQQAIISTNKDEPLSITIERKIIQDQEVVWFKQDDRLVERALRFNDSINGLPAGKYMLEMIAHQGNISSITRQTFTITGASQPVFGHAVGAIEAIKKYKKYALIILTLALILIVLGITCTRIKEKPSGDRELLYQWVQKMHQMDFSNAQIASQLKLSAWTCADLDIILERMDIGGKIVVRHELSSEELNTLRHYIQNRQEQHARAETVIQGLIGAGWDANLISQYVMNHYR